MRHEFFPRQYDLEDISPADSTRCHSCEMQSGKDTKLKKCAGCSVAIYCSTECQKNAWPAHKRFCCSKHTQPRATIKVDEYPELRDAPPLPRFITIRAAFPTPIAVASDWATFSNYHAWALSTFIGVAAWLAAARTSTFQTEFPLDDLLLHLYVVPVNRPDQHPANSWFMRCLRLSYLARDIEADKELAQLLGKHEDDFAKVEATFKAMYGARYAGALLIEYHLGVGGLVQPAQRPLYVWHNPARFLEQTTQDAMQDFFDLLQAWICGGIVLKPADPTEKKAVPGRLVQVQKKTRVTWEWTPLDSAQVERLQRSAIPKSRTRMSFAQMAQLYASL